MSEKKKRFLDKLRNRYRLVILDDQTFEEKASFRLTRFNVYVMFSTVVVLTVAVTFLLVVFTPLKEYIPGYGATNLRKDILDAEFRTDSLQRVVRQQDLWITNVRNMLQGKADTIGTSSSAQEANYDTINLEQIPEEDLRLRKEIEKEQSYALSFSKQSKKGDLNLAQLNFFPPVRGYITSTFDPKEEHFGIDIVAADGIPIKSVMDGHVVLATWTLETGYVIGIQHDYNLVSFYKHNSVLLKKTGNFVKAGDAIAIIGSSGELTTGPHLHFELWHNGSPVNPEDYIIF